MLQGYRNKGGPHLSIYLHTLALMHAGINYENAPVALCQPSDLVSLMMRRIYGWIIYGAAGCMAQLDGYCCCAAAVCRLPRWESLFSSANCPLTAVGFCPRASRLLDFNCVCCLRYTLISVTADELIAQEKMECGAKKKSTCAHLWSFNLFSVIKLLCRKFQLSWLSRSKTHSSWLKTIQFLPSCNFDN